MVAGLDSWQAMELDLALAVKYSTLEDERTLSYLEAILAGIDNILRVNGAKNVKKRSLHKSLIREYQDPTAKAQDDGVPLIDDVLKSLGAGGTVINLKGLPKWQGRQST